LITAAHLDHAQRAKRLHGTPLHVLLLSSGAMTGPYRRARPVTVSLFSRLLRQLRAHQFKVKP